MMRLISVAGAQLENVPSRSLKRSSRPGARTSGIWLPAEARFARADELPHNSCTVGEIGWVRSPAWNSVRNIGSCCGKDAVFNSVPVVALTGVTVRTSGMVERKLLSMVVRDSVVTLNIRQKFLIPF